MFKSLINVGLLTITSVVVFLYEQDSYSFSVLMLLTQTVKNEGKSDVNDNECNF